MSENKAEWEQWTIEDAGNGKVILCGAHGKNLQAHDNGSVGMSKNKLDWEQWTVEIAGDDNDSSRGSSRGMSGASARDNSDIIGKRVILCGAHGKNLQAHGSGSVDMSENKAEWEQWTIEDAGNGKVILCGAHGKNLQAHGSGSVDMSENKLDWEQWTVEIA